MEQKEHTVHIYRYICTQNRTNPLASATTMIGSVFYAEIDYFRPSAYTKIKWSFTCTMVRVDFRLLRRTLKMFSLKTCLFFFFKKSQTSKKYFFSKLQDSKLIHPNVQLHILFSLSFIVLHLQGLFQVRNTFETQIQSNCIVLK